MLAIAKYSLKGRSQAVLVLTVITILAWVLPFVSCISTGLLLLISMQQKFNEVLNVVGLSALAIMVFAGFLQEDFLDVAMLVSAFWVPAILSSYVLRKTGSISLTIMAIAALSSLLVLAVFGLSPDPEGQWVARLDTTQNREVIQSQWALSKEQTDNAIHNFAKIITVSLGFAITINSILGVLLAFWWQGRLYPPGTLQQRFHELRFGKVATIAAVLISMLALSTALEWLVALMLIWLVIFIFQGLAVVHNLVLKKGWDSTWLMIMYATIIILPLFMFAMLMMVGIGDSWSDFRNRI